MSSATVSLISASRSSSRSSSQHGLTPELLRLYDANRVAVTHQLRYEASGNEIDLCLLVNGIPTATAELKNPLTGQNVDHAVTQYRTDRDPTNTTLSRRRARPLRR